MNEYKKYIDYVKTPEAALVSKTLMKIGPLIRYELTNEGLIRQE